MLEIFYSENPKDIARGRLWRITAPNGNVNYLLGTMHLDFRMLTQGTPELNLIFNQCHNFLFEWPNYTQPFDELFRSLKSLLHKTVPDSVVKKLAYNENLDTAHEHLSKIAYKIISDFYQRANEPNPYTMEMVQSLNFLTLRSIAADYAKCLNNLYNATSLDAVLFSDAYTKQNDDRLYITVRSVETLVDRFDNEVDFINRTNIPDVILYTSFLVTDILSIHGTPEYLVDVANSFGCVKSCKDFIYFVQTMFYLAGLTFEHKDPDLIEYEYPEPKDLHYFILKNVKPRNDRMWAQIAPQFEQGACFFATGHAHCSGEDGFLATFKKNGFKVERIFETQNINQSYFKTDLANALLLTCLSFTLADNNIDKKNLFWLKNLHILSSYAAISTNPIYPGKNVDRTLKASVCLYMLSNLAQSLFDLPNPDAVKTLQIILPILQISFNLMFAFTMRWGAPAGKQGLWEQRSAQMYKRDNPNDKTSEAPVIQRAILTSYMQANMNKPVVFTDSHAKNAVFVSSRRSESHIKSNIA